MIVYTFTDWKESKKEELSKLDKVLCFIGKIATVIFAVAFFIAMGLSAQADNWEMNKIEEVTTEKIV